MKIKRIIITLLLVVIVTTSYAIYFDCKINYAGGIYNGKTEEEMIKLNSLCFENDIWQKLWEQKKTELNRALIREFNKNGKQNSIMAGNFENSVNKLQINVISIDPDGEARTHVLAYLNDTTTGEFVVYIDKAFSANGGKDATYTNLNTQGFSSIGSKIAVELSKRIADYQETIEVEEKQKAKEAALEAEDAKNYVENPTDPEKIDLTMSYTYVENATPLYPIKIERKIVTTEAETKLQCYKDIKEKASKYGATIVFIERIDRIGRRLVINALSYKEENKE